jgi:hypothetical protein
VATMPVWLTTPTSTSPPSTSSLLKICSSPKDPQSRWNQLPICLGSGSV